MTGIGFGRQGMVGIGTSSLQDNKSLLGFEELAMPLFDSLYNFARWLVHNPNDAEDLVQETYLKALRAFASFQPGTNFRAWMFRILKNTFLSSCSKLERRMTVAIDLEEDGSELAVEIAEVLSIPIGTVMSRLARARKAVRESLRGTSSAAAPAEAAQEPGAARGNEKGVHQPGLARAVPGSASQEPGLVPLSGLQSCQTPSRLPDRTPNL